MRIPVVRNVTTSSASSGLNSTGDHGVLDGGPTPPTSTLAALNDDFLAEDDGEFNADAGPRRERRAVFPPSSFSSSQSQQQTQCGTTMSKWQLEQARYMDWRPSNYA